MVEVTVVTVAAVNMRDKSLLRSRVDGGVERVSLQETSCRAKSLSSMFIFSLKHDIRDILRSGFDTKAAVVERTVTATRKSMCIIWLDVQDCMMMPSQTARALFSFTLCSKVGLYFSQ